MLHLLPQSYMQQVRKEYRQRCLVAACNLFSFCLLVFVLGMIPSLVIINAEKNELNRQSTSLTFRISDEDLKIATDFESSVKMGTAILRDTKALSSQDVKKVLSLKTKGIIFRSFIIVHQGESQQIQLQGVAAARNDLSSFVRNINEGGEYMTDEIPASTFTKDKDLEFSIVLQEVKKATQ